MPGVPGDSPGLSGPGGPAPPGQTGGHSPGPPLLVYPHPVQEAGAPLPDWHPQLRSQSRPGRENLFTEDD